MLTKVAIHSVSDERTPGAADARAFGSAGRNNLNPGECCGGTAALAQRYCDLPYGGPEVLGEIIGDLRCVFEKCFGSQASAEDKFRDIRYLSDRIKQEFCALFCLKEELEYEIVRLHPELKKVRSALDDEVRRIAELGRIVNHLKAQLVRADAMLDASCRDKAALQSQFLESSAELEKLEAEIKKLENQRHALESEGFELRAEVTKEAPTSKISHKCEGLEEALAKCVRMNDEYGQKLANLERINRRLQQDLKACGSNKQRLLNELERCRQCARKEFRRLNDLIADLRKAVDCLTKHNAELCKKFQQVINGHRSEIEQLHDEIARFKIMLDNETKLRVRAEQSFRESGPGPRFRPLSPSVRRRQFNCEAPCCGLFERIQYKLVDSDSHVPPCMDFMTMLGSDKGHVGLYNEGQDQGPDARSQANFTHHQEPSGAWPTDYLDQSASHVSGQSTEVMRSPGPSNRSSNALSKNQIQTQSLGDEIPHEKVSRRKSLTKNDSIGESSPKKDPSKASTSTPKSVGTPTHTDGSGPMPGLKSKTDPVCEDGSKPPGQDQLRPMTLKTPPGSVNNFKSCFGIKSKGQKKDPPDNKPGGSGSYQTYPVMVKYNVDPKSVLESKTRERQKSRVFIQAKGVGAPVSTTTLESRSSQNCSGSSSRGNQEEKAEHYRLLNQKSERRVRHLKDKLERERIKQQSLMEHNESLRQELQNTNEQIHRLSQIPSKYKAVLRCIPDL